jgi:L-aminopeptidase/D-esterase-like protein
MVDFEEYIPGVRIGHAHDEDALTGCTVILCESGAVGGIDQRGGAPGTRETDALYPMHLVQEVHAVVLAGGSAFGLDAASGVMRYLEERGIGFDVRVARVPIVPSAILFDLGIGRSDIRPDAAMGYQACLNASNRAPAEGSVGAGTGATVGKILGPGQAMKSGIGCARQVLGDGIIIAAVVAVNALGDVVDPDSGRILAGARAFGSESLIAGEKGFFADTLLVMEGLLGQQSLGFGRGENTVVGVVMTNARLTKEQVNKVAQMAQDGIARSVRPAHTMLDGDTLFSLSIGYREADVNIVGAYAAEVTAQAIIRAVKTAQTAGGLPTYSDLESREGA